MSIQVAFGKAKESLTKDRGRSNFLTSELVVPWVGAIACSSAHRGAASRFKAEGDLGPLAATQQRGRITYLNSNFGSYGFCVPPRRGPHALRLALAGSISLVAAAVICPVASSRHCADAKVQRPLDDGAWMRRAAKDVLLAFALLLLPSLSSAQLVTRVVDGDTIVVEGVGSVRLIGVDTPETVDPRKPVQLFGKEASEFTSRMA